MVIVDDVPGVSVGSRALPAAPGHAGHINCHYVTAAHTSIHDFARSLTAVQNRLLCAPLVAANEADSQTPDSAFRAGDVTRGRASLDTVRDIRPRKKTPPLIVVRCASC